MSAELKVECLRLAVSLCLARAEKSDEDVVKSATALYHYVNSAGESAETSAPGTSPERTLHLRRRK